MNKSDRDSSSAEGWSYEPQLVVNELILPSGGEWSPQLPGWLVIHINAGAGYWLHPRMNCELLPGAVVLLSDQIQGCVRASQVGELRLQYFCAEPRRITGLVSLADQRLLHDAARDEKLALRVLPPSAPFSDKFRKLGSREAGNSFPVRAQLLQLFLEVFGGCFEQPQAETSGGVDAKERLSQTLNRMPVSELLEISFSELVGRTGCSARHVSRLFTELVGVSFREKQVELRLARACQLLATTNSKVVDVALESGYQSTSLFNLIFKQRFGVSPAKWRDRARKRKPVKEVIRRLRVAA